MSDEKQEHQDSTQIVEGIFETKENIENTAALFGSFLASYQQRGAYLRIDEWLITEFHKHRDVWTDEAEMTGAARDIVLSIERASEAKASLYSHLDKKKSKESWLAKQIDAGATAAGVTHVGAWAKKLDDKISEANLKAFDSIFNEKPDVLGDWEVSNSPYMHGFIAEHDIANRFNLNAAASQSGVAAQVVESTSMNSPDLVVRDAAGKIVQHVQVKSYADVQQLINNIRAHGYSAGTTLLVHADQVARLRREFPELNVTSALQAGDVSSEMPSYEELKQLQHDAQAQEESRQYEWNDVNRINVTKGIAKQALTSACIAACMQGARILGRRAWNAVSGKANPSASEDLKEFFDSSIRSAKHVGVQCAVSGALVVAAKNGWLGKAMKGTPAGIIANIAYVGMENARVLVKYARGEISGIEAIDAMGNVTCSALGSLYAAGLGAQKGMLIGAPYGPIGIAIGGVIGGIVGGIAGSKIGESLYEGGKSIFTKAFDFLKSLWKKSPEAPKETTRDMVVAAAPT